MAVSAAAGAREDDCAHDPKRDEHQHPPDAPTSAGPSAISQRLAACSKLLRRVPGGPDWRSLRRGILRHWRTVSRPAGAGRRSGAMRSSPRRCCPPRSPRVKRTAERAAAARPGGDGPERRAGCRVIDTLRARRWPGAVGRRRRKKGARQWGRSAAAPGKASCLPSQDRTRAIWRSGTG